MSGKPGCSGGARENSGPPKRPPEKITVSAKDPLEFLLIVMNDNEIDARLRVRAAVAAAQYCHRKIGESGKKDEKDRAAKAAGSGKFAPAEAPKLVINNR